MGTDYVVWLMYNLASLATWLTLAIHFEKWWIIFFAVFTLAELRH